MDNNNDSMQKQNLSPIAAGITGLILGIVGTAAVALSDEQTRTKVTKKANAMKDKMEKWSKDTLHELKETGDEIKTRGAEKSDEMKTYADTATEKMETIADDTLREENRKFN